MEILAVLAGLAFLIGIPILRERIKISRIRREWYARGQGFNQGKYSVARHPSYYNGPTASSGQHAPDAYAPIVPERTRLNPLQRVMAWAAVAIAGLMGLGFIGAALSHQATTANGAVTLQEQQPATSHNQPKRHAKTPAHKRFAHAGACDTQFALNAQGYIATDEEKRACKEEIDERVHEAFRPIPKTPEATAVASPSSQTQQ